MTRRQVVNWLPAGMQARNRWFQVGSMQHFLNDVGVFGEAVCAHVLEESVASLRTHSVLRDFMLACELILVQFLLILIFFIIIRL